jgi:hypothetical protein
LISSHSNFRDVGLYVTDLDSLVEPSMTSELVFIAICLVAARSRQLQLRRYYYLYRFKAQKFVSFLLTFIKIEKLKGRFVDFMFGVSQVHPHYMF